MPGAKTVRFVEIFQRNQDELAPQSQSYSPNHELSVQQMTKPIGEVVG